jgi:hypothetical protein
MMSVGPVLSRSQAKFQGRIDAVEELNRGEPQVGIANIFEVMDFVFALSIDEVPGLAS